MFGDRLLLAGSLACLVAAGWFTWAEWERVHAVELKPLDLPIADAKRGESVTTQVRVRNRSRQPVRVIGGMLG